MKWLLYADDSHQVSEGLFSVERSYSTHDIAAIGALDIGDTWTSQHYESAHTVTHIV